MRILIAEDDEPTGQWYAIILKQHGYEIDWVKNGFEALQQIKGSRQRYMLCLMDMEMPIMGGLEAIRLIRQFKPDLPIIAVSSSLEYEAQSLEAGANAFYRKPLARDSLLSITRHSQTIGSGIKCGL